MAVVKPFLIPHQMRYPVVIGNDKVASRYGLQSMPLTILIDRHGRIAAVHAGVVEKRNFEILIETLLREQSR